MFHPDRLVLPAVRCVTLCERPGTISLPAVLSCTPNVVTVTLRDFDCKADGVGGAATGALLPLKALRRVKIAGEVGLAERGPLERQKIAVRSMLTGLFDLGPEVEFVVQMEVW